jgi:thymidylate kinase
LIDGEKQSTLLRPKRASPRTLLVSFSGIDGAGKTTQIGELSRRLQHNGIPFRVVSFWDQVAALKRLRELCSHTLFKGDKGVGTAGRPLNRRDKNIQSWYMTTLRYFLYLLDTVSLWRMVKTQKDTAGVVIFDRYVYDELANLRCKCGATRVYVRFLLRITPRPDIAFLLDADPVAARRRKPEYPLEFLYQNRASYLALSRSASMTVISPLPSAETATRVTEEISKRLLQPLAQRSLPAPNQAQREAF